MSDTVATLRKNETFLTTLVRNLIAVVASYKRKKTNAKNSNVAEVKNTKQDRNMYTVS